MPANPAQFERALASGQIPPLVLIASSEPLLRIEAADRVRAAARAAGYSEREVFDVDARFDWSQVGASCGALSLFASRRIVELRLPAGKPGKEGGDYLQKYSKNSPPDLLLLIVCEDWSKKHEGAWVNAVDAAGLFLPIWPLKPADMPAWLAQRLRAQGLEASRDALELLVERVEGNLLAAAQEVDKLALLKPAGRIDADYMANVVADSARYDIFGLTDAAIAGESGRALQMLAGLRAEGEAVPPLLSWLATQVQQLLRAAETKAKGGNVDGALQAAGVWSSRVWPFKKALARGGVEHFEALLAQCAKVERMAKGREQGDAWRELERLLVSIADGRARPVLLKG
ncbi:DNA polymerase III subunit delta [Aquimonas sp.]|jgi:DNA polymerase-3 subunit delta|uniref:DNA polymerase III subunit delta n=1 Tax=Aquimonas sp. TaxID=1872588 RepID=UPI0037C0E9EE